MDEILAEPSFEAEGKTIRSVPKPAQGVFVVPSGNRASNSACGQTLQKLPAAVFSEIIPQPVGAMAKPGGKAALAPFRPYNGGGSRFSPPFQALASSILHHVDVDTHRRLAAGVI
ncbi:hypothetical protein NYE48_18030 [Paenibacillus sp. FSL M7-1455]|uniref:hypothetical protein n=1 Tax=Paenibacillus sp. FSL M7-1455 TaxID=2975316 RepID=UPI0030F7A730